MGIERREGYRVWVGGPVAPGATATTFGSLVLVRRGHEHDPRLLRHELVHVEQYRKHGFVGFLARYLAAYARWRLRRRGHWAAYRRIPFEIEAEWRARRAPILDGANTSSSNRVTGAEPSS
jgi:hypothetical protein